MATKRALGVCTWTYGPRGLEDIAASVSKLGFDGVELHGDLDAFEPRTVGRLLADHGLRVLSLTPANDVAGAPVDPAHPDAAIRRGAVDYYRRLAEFAAALDRPLMSVHGHVGRIAALASQAEERKLLIESLAAIAAQARTLGVELVYEVLNRYESHLVNTGEDALALLDEVGASNLRVLLDAYHMNIEEGRPADAVRAVGKRLGLFHVADSNRQGIGRGHTDFAALISALEAIDYRGPIIVEATAPGPNPFTPVKSGDFVGLLEGFLGETRAWLAARH